MKSKLDILSPDTTYHVYNRANGNENLFLSTENYRYFLEKYVFYISPTADTFCYCLMPNHFHFLIRVKDEEALEWHFAALTGFETLSGLSARAVESKLNNYISRRFSNLFNGYTQTFNKMHGRKGSLFIRPFKRIEVTEEIYLRKLVHYIHYNPVKATLCETPAAWPYSSYFSILAGEPTFLKSDEVIDWFGDKENFIHIHKAVQKENETHQIEIQ
jgi:putative transposase